MMINGVEIDHNFFFSAAVSNYKEKIHLFEPYWVSTKVFHVVAE